MMSTPDLADLNPDARQLPYQFRYFGLRAALSGPVATISCFEDNSRVKEAAAEPGRQRSPKLLMRRGVTIAQRSVQ